MFPTIKDQDDAKSTLSDLEHLHSLVFSLIVLKDQMRRILYCLLKIGKY